MPSAAVAAGSMSHGFLPCLTDALRAQGEAVAIADGGAGFTGNVILERAGVIGHALDSIGARRILSKDSSPASLLALLSILERRPCQLILSRPSVNDAALGAMLRPDAVVHSAEHIEPYSGLSQSAVGEDRAVPGIFLLTSGTTGAPKAVHQTLLALLGRVRTGSLEHNRGARWLLTYETHSFAGLQVVLSAALSGGLLVCPQAANPTALIQAARGHAVTHISGTPTFWRALLMALNGERLELRQITLGGETADQATLDRLAAAFPQARITHIYASTEAGALFAVHDGRAGFPAAWLEQELPGAVFLRVREEMLEALSPRRMVGYATGQPAPVTSDGWLITGDLVRLENDRVLFCGRKDLIVNVGGLKVSPVEVEEFLLSHPYVAEALVYSVPSPLTGFLLAAKVVLQPNVDPESALRDIRAACARSLPSHKAPRRFEVAESIGVSPAGKKAPRL